MDKHTSLTPFELELKAILDVQEPDGAFVQVLRTRLLRAPQTRQPQKSLVTWCQRWFTWRWGAGRTTWAWVTAIILLAGLAVFLAVGPQRVVAAARRWLGGFIPGIGFVDNQTSLRVLEKPVRISVDGAAIAVEKAYTNAGETAIQINYVDDTRACKSTQVTYEEYRSRLNEKVYLLLPDGRKLFALTPRFSSWGKFPPLPTGLNEVVLVMPSNVIYACAVKDPSNPAAASTFCQCLDDDLRWLIQLKFIVPPPGSLLPVVDNATPTALSLVSATAQPSATPVTGAAQTIQVTATPQAGPQPELVGKLVSLDDGYLILAALKRDRSASVSYSFGLNERHFKLFDAAGNAIPVEEIDRSQVNPDVFNDFQWGDTLLLRTHTTQVAGPLKLTFSTLVQAQYQFGKEAEFAIDLGPTLQPGQRIPLEENFDFIPGYPFTLRQLTVDSLTGGQVGVTLTFAGQGYETIQVNQVPFPDPPPQGGSSGPCADFPGCYYTSTSFTHSPDNHYNLSVGSLEHVVQGAWSLSFEIGQAAP
jgi:hypothetical protein